MPRSSVADDQSRQALDCVLKVLLRECTGFIARRWGVKEVEYHLLSCGRVRQSSTTMAISGMLMPRYAANSVDPAANWNSGTFKIVYQVC